VFNRVYYQSLRFGSSTKTIPLQEFLFPIQNKELYFHLFGKRGFHECQFVIPVDEFAAFAAKVQRRLAIQPVAVALASAKLFRGERELLRFTGDGICFALDFPRDNTGAAFATFLDELVVAHYGWPNLIKDSRLTQRIVAATYPEYDLFRSRLRAFDPERRFRSELSERLDL
jgi:decaprenylphospho-beta-D-ribofuranose 2-oxidase